MKRKICRMLSYELCSDSVKWLEGKRFDAGTAKETLEGWLEVILKFSNSLIA